jgi:hypothetical protein
MKGRQRKDDAIYLSAWKMAFHSASTLLKGINEYLPRHCPKNGTT